MTNAPDGRLTMVVTVVVTRHRRELLGEVAGGDRRRRPGRPTTWWWWTTARTTRPRTSSRTCRIPATYLPSLAQPGWRGRVRAGDAARAGAGRGLGVAGRRRRPPGRRARVLRTLLEEAKRRDLAAISPVVVNIDDPERLAFPLRRGLTWKRRRSELGDRLPARHRVASSTARCSAPTRWTSSACRTTGCSSGATRWRCTAGWSAPGCASAPRCGPPTRTRTAQRSSSRCCAGTSTPRTPPTRSSATTPTATAATCCRSPACARIGMLEVFRFGLYFLGTKRDPRAFRQWLKLLRQGRAERFYRH